jgi:hypothetical protein
MLLQIKRAICRQLMSSGNRLTSFQGLSCGKLLWLSAGPVIASRVKGDSTVRKQLQSRTVPSRRQPSVIGGSFIGQSATRRQGVMYLKSVWSAENGSQDFGRLFRFKGAMQQR